MGKKGLQLELETASVNHCGAPELYYEELIRDYEMKAGTYDVTTSLDEQTRLPSDRYIGSAYARLIVDVYEAEGGNLLDIMMNVFQSDFPVCVNNYQLAYYFMQSNILEWEYLYGEFDPIEGSIADAK